MGLEVISLGKKTSDDPKPEPIKVEIPAREIKESIRPPRVDRPLKETTKLPK
jgi:hypothetical protein